MTSAAPNKFAFKMIGSLVSFFVPALLVGFAAGFRGGAAAVAGYVVYEILHFDFNSPPAIFALVIIGTSLLCCAGGAAGIMGMLVFRLLARPREDATQAGGMEPTEGAAS